MRQMMDLRQLRYFSVLAAQQHFGRAADVLHIAQPALTRQMKLLEEELGVMLFERHARGAALTEAGVQLQSRAEFLLRCAQQLRDDIATHQREPAGAVAIGLSPGMAPLLAAPLTLRIQQRYPSMRLRFVEGFAPVLHEAVLGGQIDVAVLNGAVRGIDLVMEPLLREQMCLIGPAKDKRLKAASISVRHLDGLPLVMTGLAKSGVRLELEAAAWNVAVTHQPTVVVAATCAADVVAAVRFAAGEGLAVAVQGTGHGATTSFRDGVLVTTRRMADVSVDADRRTARVGAGAVWRDVIAAAAPHGLAPLSGSASGVGVAGFTLGGGMGLLSRKHGFADFIFAHKRFADGVCLAIQLLNHRGQNIRAATMRNEMDFLQAGRARDDLGPAVGLLVPFALELVLGALARHQAAAAQHCLDVGLGQRVVQRLVKKLDAVCRDAAAHEDAGP